MRDILIEEYKDINLGELLELYGSVGWSNYTERPSMLEASYKNSLKALAARDGVKLAGIIRVVGDGYSVIYVQDILVMPEYQGRGIGSALVMAVSALFENVYQKVLLTDDTEKTSEFYEKCGFSNCAELQCAAFVKFTLPKT